MSDDVPKYARDQIDAEALALQGPIRSLRSCPPLHKLPPEVISQIFKWVQLLYRGKFERSISYSGSFLRWVEVTHVCQHWRNIALNSKSLYSTILVHNLRCSEEAFKLSGSAALSIIDSVDDGSCGIWGNPKLRKFVLAAVPRLRSLWLSHRAEEFFISTFKRSDLVLPVEELCLSRWRDFTRTMFPSSLRYLQLNYCGFKSYDWLSRLSNMVELNITSDPDSATQRTRIPLDTLMNALDRMPRLISLELSSVLSAAEHQRISPITPKLQSLTLRDTPDKVTAFLPWLTFAPRFTIDLFVKSSGRYNEPETTLDWLPPVVEQLGQHLRSSKMVLRNTKFSWAGESHSNEEADIVLSDEAHDSSCRLKVLLGSREQVHTWLKSTEALPLRRVKSVTINAPLGIAEWSDGPWSGIRALRQLSLPNEETSSTFLQYLTAHGPTQEDPSNVFPPSFASLKKLSLDGVQHDHEFTSKIETFDTRMRTSDVKFRKSTFKCSKITPKSIKKLPKEVDAVEQEAGRKTSKKKHRRT